MKNILKSKKFKKVNESIHNELPFEVHMEKWEKDYEKYKKMGRRKSEEIKASIDFILNKDFYKLKNKKQ